MTNLHLMARREGPRLVGAVWGVILILASSNVSVEMLAQETFDVTLNHIFVVLDSATYEGVVESDFLTTKFGSFEQRTTAAADGSSWSGLYFYGESNYFEFFAPGAIDYPVGFTGFAYGVDDPAALDWVQQRWESELGAKVSAYTRERVKPDGSSVPWFDMRMVVRQDEPSQLMTWAMAWHPGFMRGWYGDPDPPAGALTRRDYLARHYRRDLLLRDVIGIALVLPEEEAGTLKRELLAVGYAVDEHERGWVAERPDIEFRVRIAEDESAGLRALHFKVAAGEPQVLEISPSSTLTFDGSGGATWSFFSR